MAELDQFNQSASNTLSDFQDENQVAPPITSASSNQNMAAHAALLSPRADQVADVYNTSKEEFDTLGTSPTLETVVTNAKAENAQAYRATAADFLMNPEVTDEWKQNALGRINDPSSDLYRVRAMVATQEASKVNPDETEEAGNLRGVWAAGINKVLDFQREKQKFYNEMQLRQDANKSAGYVGMAEDLVPTVSGYKTASLVSDLTNSGSLSTLWGTFLPGESKQKMVENFNQIPFEERANVMNKAMDIIAQHGSTITLPEEQDQANMAIFRDMVEAGDYTATDRVIDNVLGVLDVVGVLGAIKVVSKAGRAATDAVRGAGEIPPAGAAGDIPPTGGAGPTNARRPTAEADWRTHRSAEPVTVDQNGNPSNAVGDVIGTEVDARNWHRQFALTDVQPTSPSQVIKDANPDMARRLHDAVEQDVAGDAANAAYGTSRQDAIAHDISPQVATVDGSVVSKVFHPEQASDFRMMPNAEILDFVDNSGAAWLSYAEKRRLRAVAVNDFRNATGLVARKEMSTVEAVDDGVRFSSVYGPTDTGWSDVKEAVHQAKFALRNYGITEDNINILVRNGEQYKPVTPEIKAALLNSEVPSISGDYLLKVDVDYKFNSSQLDADGFEAFDVKNNVIDRWFPGGGARGEGTVQSSVLDPQSMLNPKLTKGATIGGLRAAQLEEKLMTSVKPYVDTVKALPAERQGKVFHKIREANAKGQSFNYANLVAEGFTQKEIRALEHWKEAQDTLYHISNRDLVKTYRNRGYGLIEHPDTGTRLLVKDLNRNQVVGDVSVFDPLTDSVRKMSKQEITEHYAKQGTIAKVDSPITLDGVTVEHVLSMNKPGSTFVRALNPHDTLLNYRKGYYAVRYTDPHFIEKKVLDDTGRPMKDASGNEIWRAVATAANIPDAKRAVERMTSTTGGEYRFRGNLKGEDFDRAEAQRLQAGGMSAQRVRGNRLEEAVGQGEMSEQANLESPINSLINSVASVANRVSMRDYLETAKARFVAQFDEVLPKVKGQTQYPRTRAEIGQEGQKTSKMAADARTTWEYIRQLENGYVNSIDDGWKAMANGVAEIFGHRGLGRAEEVVRTAGKVGPSNLAKSVAFNLYIVSNPIRQFLIQSHQVMMLGATFPRYTFMHMADDITLMATYALGAKPSKQLLKLSGRTEAEASAMWEALRNSGISAGISKHELVRQSLSSIADEANAARSIANPGTFRKYVGNPTSAVFRGMRKVGFDAGEWVSSSASFLAHYDEAVRAGRKMTQSEIDDITTKSRNYVYNMDRAGSMPWTRNSLSIITQFLEQPFKAITQFTTNRSLTAAEKSRIALFMVGTFGTHSITGAIPKLDSVIETYLNELLPDDPLWRDATIRGLESLALNALFTKWYGEKVELDYSSLSPLDSYGLFEFMQGVTENGIIQVFASSPSGSLVFGTNPRISQLGGTLATMMGLKDSKYDADPVSWSNLAKDTAGLLSGASNAMKAAYALEYGRKIGALGGTTDTRVNSFEAIAQAMGINTMDEKHAREIMDTTWKNSEALKKDVKQVFDQVSKHLVQDGITPDQFEYVVAQSKAMMAAFKGNPAAVEEWNALMRKQATNKDYRMMETILKQCGFMGKGETLKLINKIPNITEEQRRNLIDVCNFNAPEKGL